MCVLEVGDGDGDEGLEEALAAEGYASWRIGDIVGDEAPFLAAAGE